MLSVLTPEEFDGALDAVATAVLEEAGVERPPVDAYSVAAALGIAVARDDRQRGRARCVRLRAAGGQASRPAILLRSEPRGERLQWATAHEISEQAAYRVYAVLGVDPRTVSPGARESVANRLAGRLLLPHLWFAADVAECDGDLLALKDRYPTASHELIARRMLDLPPPAILTIFDHRRITLRRSNLPGRVPPLSAAETECWQFVHEKARPHQISDGTKTIRGWPIHEEGWKREILRTLVDPDLVG